MLSHRPKAQTLRQCPSVSAILQSSQSWQRSQRSIGMLNAIVLGMARMYGQKEIILTSPGFIPRNLQDEVNHVIDRALNSQIVISSLDPKGVALLMPEVDVTSNFDPKFISLMNSFAGSRELYATAVLAQVAEETGGDFFHHNNDLNAGFARLNSIMIRSTNSTALGPNFTMC